MFKSDNDEALRAKEKTMNAVTGGGDRGGFGGFGSGNDIADKLLLTISPCQDLGLEEARCGEGAGA